MRALEALGIPFSSFSPLSLPPSRHSLPPRPAPPPPAVPLFSRLLSPFGAAPPSLLQYFSLFQCSNMGCKQRGFRGQRVFDHTTGQGYVKSQRGHYHDGIFTKRNKFNLLLHETFGGGFSPPAVAKINRLARKAQRSGVDRTAYPPHSRLSFVSHHAERISIASVKGVNRAILDRRAKLASELSRRA